MSARLALALINWLVTVLANARRFSTFVFAREQVFTLLAMNLAFASVYNLVAMIADAIR